MRAIKRDDGGVTYAYSFRDTTGRTKNVQTTVYSSVLADHIRAQADLIEKADKKRSLKNSGVKFGELVDSVVKKNQGGGQPWVYAAIKKHFGTLFVGDSLVREYHDYIEDLENDDYSHNTIQHHKSAIRRVLNYAYETGRIDSIPIRKFDISFEFRDRIWNSDQERLKFFNKMIEIRSHLYWSMLLLEKRPIRAKSDLWRLTDDNLILFGEGAPYLRFVAKKTSNKNAIQKETFIPLKGVPEIVEYLTKGRPANCSLLFPNVYLPKGKSVFDFEFMRTAEWTEMGSPKKHFNYICEKSGILDLHIHDFKHMAMKHMIEEENFTIEQLTAFGVQFDDKLIKKVYWQKNAIKMMSLPSKNNDSVSDSVSVISR